MLQLFLWCTCMYLLRSQSKALHALITKISKIISKIIIVQALLRIWEIQGPQNLGFVQKLSLIFASRSKETKVHVSCQRLSGSARAKSTVLY